MENLDYINKNKSEFIEKIRNSPSAVLPVALPILTAPVPPVPQQTHKDLKRRALERNVTVSKYIIDSVMARIRGESKYD